MAGKFEMVHGKSIFVMSSQGQHVLAVGNDATLNLISFPQGIPLISESTSTG